MSEVTASAGRVAAMIAATNLIFLMKCELMKTPLGLGGVEPPTLLLDFGIKLGESGETAANSRKSK